MSLIGRVLLGLLLASYPLSAQPWQPFTALAVLADESALVTGGLGGEVLWMDLKTGEVQFRWLLEGRGPVVGLHGARPENLVVVTFADGHAEAMGPHQTVPTERATDSESREAAQRWRSQGPSMSGVVVTHAGNRAFGSPDGTIRVRFADGRAEVAWKAHSAAVTGLVWSADGTVLYSCSFDGGVAVWVAQTGEVKSRL